MMLAVSSQRSQCAVLLLSVLLTLLDVSHGGKKTPNAEDQAGTSNQNDGGPETSQEESDYVTMEWEKFTGKPPTDAYKFKNIQGKDMYVCRNMEKKCFVGILTGFKCEYETGKKEKLQNPGSFEVLVNKDNFEELEWKSIKCTGEVEEVYEDAVLICNDQNLYIGRRGEEVKSLPGDKFHKNHSTKRSRKTRLINIWDQMTGSCKVLTISYKNVKDQETSEFEFKENKKKEFEMGILNVEKTEITNGGDMEIVHTVQPTKTISRETRWDLSYSLSKGVKLNVGAKFPLGFEAALEFGRQSTTTEGTGTSVKQDTGVSSSFQVRVPKRSKCTIKLVSRQLRVETPFTFKLTRYYNDKEPKTKVISGTQDLRDSGKTEFVIETCEPLPGNVASAGRGDPGKGITINNDRVTSLK